MARRSPTALIAAPQVKKVNFTGSTNVGSVIAGLAGKNLKPVLMELGGKAPAIVCEDADLQLAALNCTLGSFLYSGPDMYVNRENTSQCEGGREVQRGMLKQHD